MGIVLGFRVRAPVSNQGADIGPPTKPSANLAPTDADILGFRVPTMGLGFRVPTYPT